MSVPCILPRQEDYETEFPPEELGDEWATSETCTHDHCIEVAGYARAYEAYRRVTLTPEEREEIESDRELMLDEFHGSTIS